MKMQFFLALTMCFFIGSTAGYIGSLMLTKRMALMGGALGHLTLPGITLALLYNFDVSIGAFLFLILGIAAIWLFEQKTKLPTEALTAVVFATSIAISFIFLPQEKTVPALIGDISQISLNTTFITLILSIIIFLITRTIFSKIILISISTDVAKAEKINVKLYNFIYLFCIALTVALGVRIVGGLLTAALVAIPACISKNLSKNLFQYSYGALFFGGLSCITGSLMFKFTHISIGPLIIISSSFIFLISLFFKKTSFLSFFT
ncbi:metal ABC transporter permease [Candidatus Dependentiae bacterium]|nr:metal ABC transporter permease [Candidatus Dependentiae bacterium]